MTIELLLVVIILIIIGIWRYSQNYIPHSDLFFKLKPNNTAFAFDLHGVIVKPNISEMLKVIWYDFPKKIVLWLLVTPSMWPSLFKLTRATLAPEQFLDILLKKYPQFKTFETGFIKLMNSQQLKQDTVDLIIKLKEKGYPIFLASNINLRTLTDLEKKLPVLATLFDGICIPNPSNNYASKPHKEFYVQLKSCIAKYDSTKNYIIFIDNYLPNIKAAFLSGIQGITFNTAQQVLNHLIDSGLNEKR